MAARTRSDLANLKPAFFDVNLNADLTTPILIVGVLWFLYVSRKSNK